MTWDEKIDQIVRRFSPTDFRNPFTEGSRILQKVERTFIEKSDSLYHLCNWESRMKNKQQLFHANGESVIEWLALYAEH